MLPKRQILSPIDMDKWKKSKVHTNIMNLSEYQLK